VVPGACRRRGVLPAAAIARPAQVAAAGPRFAPLPCAGEGLSAAAHERCLSGRRTGFPIDCL